MSRRHRGLVHAITLCGREAAGQLIEDRAELLVDEAGGGVGQQVGETLGEVQRAQRSAP